MDSRLKRHRMGFWLIRERPTANELQNHYAEKYYQSPISSSYQTSYTQEELGRIKARAQLRHFAVSQLRGGATTRGSSWTLGAVRDGYSANSTRPDGKSVALTSRHSESQPTIRI